MRQIKYRGKRIGSGEWVYGCLLLQRIGDQKAFITPSDKDIPVIGVIYHEVNPKTVGQLAITINEVDFYEGDITTNGVITFFEDLNWDSGGSYHPGFYFKDNFFRENNELEYHISFDEDLKLLGNIYDNPELIPK